MDAQRFGDVPVVQALHEQAHHLLLARRQRGSRGSAGCARRWARRQGRSGGCGVADGLAALRRGLRRRHGAHPGQRGLDRTQQLFSVKRFLQKVHCVGPEGLPGRRHVAVRGDDDHRQRQCLLTQQRLQLQAAHAGHADVRHHTTPPARLQGRQEVFC
jgi:hypothetical protein